MVVKAVNSPPTYPKGVSSCCWVQTRTAVVFIDVQVRVDVQVL